jgi:hypothetical protein
VPSRARASLLAVDGSTTNDLADQLTDLPGDVTRAIVSVGGNDALLNSDILNLPVASTREALLLFGQRVAKFLVDYRTAVLAVADRVAQTTVCTIYNGNLPAEEAPAARIALTRRRREQRSQHDEALGPGPPSSFDHGVRLTTKAPANLGCGRRRRHLAAVNALEVAPAAQADQVLVLVAAAARTKPQVVRRDIAPSTTRTLTAVEVARVDGPESNVWDARTPSVGEEIAGEP